MAVPIGTVTARTIYRLCAAYLLGIAMVNST